MRTSVSNKITTTATALALVGALSACSPATSSDTTLVESPPLQLSLGDSGAAMASCLPIEAQFMADMPVAFKATAEQVDGETVTLSVSQWYQGGDTSTVILDAPSGLEALIGGIDFQEGDEYLITASEGTVNYCGYSGPADADLQAVFDEAFPG